MNSGMNSDPKAERIGDDKRKNKGRQSGKPSNPIPNPIQNTPAFLAEVCIPDGIDRQRAVDLLSTWYRHFLQSKNPMLPNDPRLETVARDMRRDGIDKVEERMSYAINRNQYRLTRLPEERAGASVTTKNSENPEWLEVISVCRRYPGLTDGDMSARRNLIPRDAYKAACTVGITRIATASEYDLTQLANQFAHSLREQRERATA